MCILCCRKLLLLIMKKKPHHHSQHTPTLNFDIINTQFPMSSHGSSTTVRKVFWALCSPPSRPARQSAPKVASDKCCQDKQSWGGKGRREQHDSTNNTKMKNAEHRWHQRWLGICGQKPGVTPSGKQKTKKLLKHILSSRSVVVPCWWFRARCIKCD